MSYEFTLLIGYRYEYGLEHDPQPFRIKATIDIGNEGYEWKSPIFDLKHRIDKGEFAYPAIDVRGMFRDGDTKYTVDDYDKTLCAIPHEVVLKALRKEVKRREWYECAIVLIESMARRYERLEVVLYGE